LLEFKKLMSETAFKVPKMGESITEGTIINWVVQEGDAFEEGDILVEIATDKVDNEVPAPFSGVMISHKAQANDVVAVGSEIAILEEGSAGSKSEEKSKSNLKSKEKEASSKPSTKVEASTKSSTKKPLQKTASVGIQNNTFYSPLVISIAKEHHISFEELARIEATGNDGRLRKSDVFKYIDAGRPYQFSVIPAKAGISGDIGSQFESIGQQMMQLGQELNDTLAELKALKEQPVVEQSKPYTIPQLKLDKGTGKIVEMDRMRSIIADHMVYSKHTSPHVTAYVEADMTNIVNWRNANKVKFQETYGEKLTFTPLFVEAVANAITEFPMINVSVDGKNIIVKEHINVGMATALPSGNLIVPVVKDADKKNLQELATDVNRMANLARENKLGGDDIKGSTFTISNVGTFGSVMGTPIINQPEAAILATGIIKKRPEVITKDGEDTIEIRSMMYLSLSFDHRIVDGFLGGSFLKKIADNLEQFDTNREI
jgi:2-oxoglutarate dehydrogenase E2 component (dihydrolipoamide succinyltransferase)